MKTIEELKKNGEYRPSVHGDCVLPVEVPDCPGDMSPVAKAMWANLTEAAKFAGTLSRVDGSVLRVACENWEVYLEAKDHIKENGVIVSGQYGPKSNPSTQVMKNASDTMLRCLKEFGLTPKSRIGMQTGGKAGKTDESRRIGDILGLDMANN